jgi:hypothetical protein
MEQTDSRVTIHMVASLDGFIARKDGSVDWLETSDTFADGKSIPFGRLIHGCAVYGGTVPFRSRRHNGKACLPAATSMNRSVPH